MKQHQMFATLVVGLALSGLSALPAHAAAMPEDVQAQLQALNFGKTATAATGPRAQSRAPRRLSLDQMDKISGGMINQETPPPVPQYGSDGRGVTCRHLSCAGL